MRTNDAAPTAALRAALDALAAQDPAIQPACSVRRDLRELLTATNRLHAELVRRVAAFDATRSSGEDGYRTTRAWLRVFGRLSHGGATRLVRAARLLGGLPRLADAAARGAVSAEHVYRVDRLAEQIGVEAVRPVEAALAEFASWVDPTVLSRACARIRRPGDLDRGDPTSSSPGGMVTVQGPLGPDSLITPEDIPAPPEDTSPEEDSPSQGEALAERDRLGWRGGRGWAGARFDRRPPSRPGTTHPGPPGPPGTTSPGVTGIPAPARPGVLRRLADLASGALPQRTVESDAPPPGRLNPHRAGPSARPAPPSEPLTHRRDARRGAGPDGGDPANAGLNGVDDVADGTGRRNACDADIREVMFDPASGRTTSVDGPHRLVPDALRRALHIRDAGCTFPGCDLPPEWTDAHLLRSWANGGRAELANIVLLCRHHHGFVHEGGWTITRDAATGILEARRPDGGRFGLFDPPPA